MGTMRRGSGVGVNGGGKEGSTEGSSVLFSLGELMKIEEQRVDEERHRAATELASAERARAVAEARVAQEAEARLAAERARAEADARLAREESARLEAMRVAAIERARVEAEEGARLAAMNAAQEHERSLVALREDASKKSLSRWLALAVVGGAVVLLGGLGLYFGKLKPDAEAKERLAIAETEKARGELETTKRELARRESAVAQLEKERDAVTDARAKAELDAKILAEKKEIAKLSPGKIVVPPPTTTTPPPLPCKGDPNDPLNPCLGK